VAKNENWKFCNLTDIQNSQRVLKVSLPSLPSLPGLFLCLKMAFFGSDKITANTIYRYQKLAKIGTNFGLVTIVTIVAID